VILTAAIQTGGVYVNDENRILPDS